MISGAEYAYLGGINEVPSSKWQPDKDCILYVISVRLYEIFRWVMKSRHLIRVWSPSVYIHLIYNVVDMLAWEDRSRNYADWATIQHVRSKLTN